MRGTQEGRAGFSLVELLVITGLIAIVLGIAIPSIGVGDRVRVNNVASEVRGALQTARLRAIAYNASLQVRFNCPEAGQVRVVQANQVDRPGLWPNDSGRCSQDRFPYPASSDAAYNDMPRYDGPIQYLNPRVNVSSTTSPALVLEFGPDGRVTLGDGTRIANVSVAVSLNGYTKTIIVNSLGKVVTE